MSLDAPARPPEWITDLEQLEQWIRLGEKPQERHRIGVETEKLGVVTATGLPPPIARTGSPDGACVEAVLEGLAARTGGTLLTEGVAVIGVKLPQGGAVTLEPGGQLELSGAPHTELQPIADELAEHLRLVREVSEPLGLTWLGVGYRPWGTLADAPWLQRGRYALMRRRLPGRHAHDMMQSTASVQINYDFVDQDDAASKVSTATAWSPLVNALSMHAPLRWGRPSGWQSFRYHLWSDVDPARSGLLRHMYELGFTYRRYIEWAMEAPLLFLRRGGTYVDPQGATLRDVWEGRVAGGPATIQDFEDLLSTLFPDVRVKRVIEVRGADAVDAPLTLGIVALWTGVLWDPSIRRRARALVDVPFEDLTRLMEDVATRGLDARLRNLSVREWLGALLPLAREGLEARRRLGLAAADEARFLDAVDEQLRQGRTPAQTFLSAWNARPEDLKGQVEALRADRGIERLTTP